jgi:Protein-tyrosine-phosphatase
MADDRFRLLFVCTANICRSPMAEQLARARLRAAGVPAAEVDVGSAGVHGHDGAAMDPRAVAALAARGVRPDGFTARTLTAPMVAEADLVLTAQRRHRAAAVTLVPPAHAKVFTILEFAELARHVDEARLGAGGPGARGRELVRHAAKLRGVIPPGETGDDIPDPYGGPGHAFADCVRIIESALTEPLRLLCGRTPVPPP